MTTLLELPLGTDGWWPRWSPDGRWLAAGNTVIRVWDMAAVRAAVAAVAALPEPWVVGPGRNARWLSVTALTFTREIDDLHAQRWQALPAVRALNATDDSTALVAANEFDAANGHWASWLTDGMRLAYDNRLLAVGVRAVRMAGDLLLTIQDAANLFTVYADGVIARTHPKPATANDFSLSPEGWIGYGYWGPALMLRPDGLNLDLTVTPWRKEGVPLHVRAAGQEWAWRPTERPGDNALLMLGNVIGEDACIIVEGLPAAAFSVWFDEASDTFQLAACSDKGQLRVRSVPRTTVRYLVQDVGGAPVLDTSGNLVDMLAYVLPNPAWRGRRTAHPNRPDGDYFVDVEGVPGDRRITNIKFGHPDHWEALQERKTATSYDILLWEDRSQSEPQFPEGLDYAFTDDVWMRRNMRPGDVIHHPHNVLVRFQPQQRTIVESFGLPYDTTLVAVYKAYWFGGDVGWQPAIEFEYYPRPGAGGRPERSVYALGVGLVIWRLLSADRTQVLNESKINLLGAQALVPTIGSRDVQSVWPPKGLNMATSLSIKGPEHLTVPQGTAVRLEYQKDSGSTPDWVEWWLKGPGLDKKVRNDDGGDTDHTWGAGSLGSAWPLAPGTYDFGLRWPDGQTGKKRTITFTASGQQPGGGDVGLSNDERRDFEATMEAEYAVQHAARQVITHTDDGVNSWWQAICDRRRAGEPYGSAKSTIVQRIREIEGRVPGNPDPGPGEPGPGPGPEPGPSQIAGRVRVVQGRFQNDAGWWLWCGLSEFSFIWQALTGNHAEVIRRADRAVALGRTVVRVFGMARNLFDLNPLANMDAWFQAFEWVLQVCAERGLYVELCVFPDAQLVMGDHGQRREWLRTLAERYRTDPRIIWQVSNEPRFNGWDKATDARLLELGDFLASILGHRDFSIGDPEDGDTIDASAETVAALKEIAEHCNILVLHSSRKEGAQVAGDGRLRRWLDHLKAFAEMLEQVPGDKAGVHDEPMGVASVQWVDLPSRPGRPYEREYDPEVNIFANVLGAIFGLGYTLHYISEQNDGIPGGDVIGAIMHRFPKDPSWHYVNDSIGDAPTHGFDGFEGGKMRHLTNGAEAVSIGYGRTLGTPHWVGGYNGDDPSKREMWFEGAKGKVWHLWK